jgi:hypothetical protein
LREATSRRVSSSLEDFARKGAREQGPAAAMMRRRERAGAHTRARGGGEPKNPIAKRGALGLSPRTVMGPLFEPRRVGPDN